MAAKHPLRPSVEQERGSSRSLSTLYDIPDASHSVVLDASLLLLVLHLIDASSPLIFWNLHTADHAPLSLAHARVNVNILGSDPQRPVVRVCEPAVDLPDEVEEDRNRGGKVGLEERGRVEVTRWGSDRVKSDVELRDDCEDGDEDAEI